MDALNIDIMIDDKPETVELSRHERPSYLLDCTWNRKPEHMHLQRVFSVEEFLQKVDSMNSSPDFRSFR